MKRDPWLAPLVLSAALVTTGEAAAEPARGASGALRAAAMDVERWQALRVRLTHTDAIGLFAKLSLRADMTALFAEVRAHHQEASMATLAELRSRFDSLVNRILAMVRDDDEALAVDVAEAREDLWLTLVEGRGLL